MAFKLGHLVGDGWQEHSYAPCFAREALETGERMKVGVPAGDPVIFRKLAECLEPPFHLLYVLHTPRGEAEPGRYQSAELDWNKLYDFLDRYSILLSGDARHDVWVHSQPANGTVVWDRHNLIYAYGPHDRYETALKRLGFANGDVQVPAPHQHHYRPEFDATARELMAWCAWRRTELQPQDEQ